MLPLISRADRHAANSHSPASWSVGMTDRGLVCGAGTVLAHRVSNGLATDVDRDRVVALLSVVAGKPLPAADVMHHVEAASAHWQRGEKALANFRLIFARLPRLADAAAVDRLAVSENLLDDGLAPSSLMKALWPLQAENLRRYNRDEPRVPAGSGAESGRWEFAGGDGGKVRFEDGRIVVAANPGVKGESYQEEKLFEERDRLGEATPAEEVAHGRTPNFFTGLPTGVGRPAWNAIDAAARDALSTIGPGRGPNYGTAVHTQMRDNLRALNDPNLTAEQSYLNGKPVDYGTKASIRVDAIEGPVDAPLSAHDLKTGSAKLTIKRIETLRIHLPNGPNMIIREVKP